MLPIKPALPATVNDLGYVAKGHVSKPANPSVVQLPGMARFIEEYTLKYSQHMYIPRETVKLLGQCPVGKNKPNVTTFEGHSYFVPDRMFRQYFRAQVYDISNNVANSLNEISLKPQSTLTLELDYRCNDIKSLLTDEVLLLHARSAMATVKRYFVSEHESLRMFVYTIEPKPKWKDNRWVLAQGMHLIFNRNVSIKDGAQISHAVSEALLKEFPEWTGDVDNVYLSQTAYKTQVSLRPPYSGKVVDCFTCSDKYSKRDDKTNELRPLKGPVDFQDGTPRKRPYCAMCNGSQRFLDRNVYRLKCILNVHGKEDLDMFLTMRNDVELQLSTVSILSLRNPTVPVAVPEDTVEFTLHEMCPKLITTTNPKVLTDMVLRDAHGKKLNVHKDLVAFGVAIGKKRSDRGLTLPYEQKLWEAVEAVVKKVSPHYEHTQVGTLTVFKNGQALLVNLRGAGNTYCVALDGTHSQNRATLWLLHDLNGSRVFGGCYSNRCARQFKQVYHVPGHLIYNVFGLLRKAATVTF